MDKITSGDELFMTKSLLSKVNGFFPLEPELEADLVKLAFRPVKLSAGQTILSAGERYKQLLLVDEGWVLRQRHVNGGGRQIVNVALPGDFLSFNAVLFETSDFDLIAKTDVVVYPIEVPTIEKLMERHRGLASALTWASAREESLLAERVVSLGRRDATERLAHIICEISARLDMMDRLPGTRLSIPLIQEDFADILGLSVIHVTRTFKRLSDLGLLAYRRNGIELLDMSGLRRIAGFDEEYLHFSRRKDARRVPREADGGAAFTPP
jgi:CRP-like cAMP-binding protein